MMTPVNTNYHELIKNIQALQNNEKQLYSDLDTLPPNTGIERQKLIVDRINNIAQSRVGLFKNLFALNSLLSQNISSETDTLQAKTQMLQTIEEELNKQKDRLRKKKDLNIKNLRLTEINTYYSQKYRAYFGVFQKIVYTCIVLLIITVLRQRYIISPNISHILAIIAVIIGLFFVIPTLLDLSIRNNMVFSEYDFPFDPQNVKNPPIHDVNKDSKNIDIDLGKYEKDLELLSEGECLGAGCCSSNGLVYDTKKGLCIVKESFLSGQSTQHPGASLINPDTFSKQLVANRSEKYYSIN